jgi:hypothetical protein
MDRLRAGEGRAADLASVLGVLIFNVEDAAALLGVKIASLRYAAYRHRISYVQYSATKWFARDDLIEYGLSRRRGRKSQLSPKPYFVTRPYGWHSRAGSRT